MKKVVPIGFYFFRAKAFAYLMAISAVTYFLFWVFTSISR